MLKKGVFCLQDEYYLIFVRSAAEKYFHICPQQLDNITVIVNKLRTNILSPAQMFWKVTEYSTEACRGRIFYHLSKPEGWWHKYLAEIY